MKQKTNTAMHGHRARLRTRLMNAGLSGFAEHEMVEYLLTFSIPLKDVKPLAKKLCAEFSTVDQILDASPDDLTRIPGMGPVSIASIVFIRQLMEQYYKARIVRKPLFPSTASTRAYLDVCFRGKKKEIFKVIFLNNKNCLIAEKNVHEGTVDRSFVYPREIIGEAIRLGATRIICAHNHPSGSSEPSTADCDITRDLVFAARPLDIDVLEHIIIGNGEYFSFAETGYLDQFYRQYEVNRSYA
ncbi:MAG: DNA repair protein RadC [Elusimicrobia bacterium]|nr:DNA repair protein RadC [Elusimicrobiota bacterium]MBD3411678.1 DNA repair protein RadC [Elusimicrobiota bacterium]